MREAKRLSGLISRKLSPPLVVWLCVLAPGGAAPALAQARAATQVAQAEPARPVAGEAPAPPSASAPSSASAPPGPAPQAQRAATPPPPRELTPAEVSALQSAMTDRSGGAILTPGNIGAIRNRIIDAQSAAMASGYSDEPPPKVRPKLMSIQPQVDMAAPQVVHLAFGMVTPITILDGGGHPWPITATAYDPRMFAVDGGGCGGQAVAPAERPSTIHIMPCRVSTYGNISITIENYPLPIVLIVRSGGRGIETVDLPVAITVRGRGASAAGRAPDAEAASTAAASRLLREGPVNARHTALVAAAAGADAGPARLVSTRVRRAGGPPDPDRLMDDFGTGVPPRSALRLRVDDPVVSAWSYGGRLYVRGPVVVVNPVQDAMAQTTDGLRVWRFDRPVPRLLVTDAEGRERAVTIAY